MVYLPLLIQVVFLVAPRLALGECNDACQASRASEDENYETVLLQSKVNAHEASSDELDVEETGDGPESVILGSVGKPCEEQEGTPILSEAACWAAMDRVGQDHYMWDLADDDYYGGSETAADFPPGCYFQKNQEATYFNKHPTGKYDKKKGSQSFCAKNFDVTNAELLFVGDSDIDYWRNTGVDFPGSFNIGIGGSTCQLWQQKVDWVAKEFQPKTVVLVCGENDFYGNNVEKTFANFQKVVGRFLEDGTRVLYMGTKPEPDSKKMHKRHNAYDALIRAYAGKLKDDATGAPPLVMVDVMSSFLELGNPISLYADDKLHMGPEGYANWVAWAQEALKDQGCWLWQNGRCVSGSASSPLMGAGNDCPSGSSKITTEAACKTAAVSVQSHSCKESCGNPGWKVADYTAWAAKTCVKTECAGCAPCRAEAASFHGAETTADWPSGCYHCDGVEGCTDGTWFNDHATGNGNGLAQPVCARN